jgi:hypothetical protein
VVALTDSHLTVVTHSTSDPVSIPHGLVAGLHRFDGSATADVLRQLETEHGVVLDDAAMQVLLDWGVLVRRR